MGWLKRLIWYFQDDENLELIPVVELNGWLQQEAKVLLKPFKPSISESLRKLKDRRWILECYLDEWQEKLKKELNPEISELFIETRRLLEQITFSEQIVSYRILSLNKSLETGFAELIQRIEQSSFVHNFAFLLAESDKTKISVNPLLKEILEMEGIRAELDRYLITSGLRKIEAISQKLEQLERRLLNCDELRALIRHKSERLKELEQWQSQKNMDYNLLQKDRRYQEIQLLDVKKNETKQKLTVVVEEIQRFFEDLKLLCNFKLFFNQEPINNYCADPIEALTRDEGLSILHLLKHAQAALTSGQLDVAADEAELLFFRLNNINDLVQWHNNYFSLKRELQQLSSGVVGQEFLTKVEDARYRLEHFTRQLDKAQEEVYRLETRLSALQERVLQDRIHLKNLIHIGLNKQIEIITENFEKEVF